MWGDDYSITCDRCGAEDLEYVRIGKRWRLLNSDGTFHVCNPVASADDFEVVA